MNAMEVVFSIYFAIIIIFVVVNRWAKKRGPHWVVDFDPSKPAIHMEEQEAGV